MTGQNALIALICMMGFFTFCDHALFTREPDPWMPGGKLMSREELERIREIWAACQED